MTNDVSAALEALRDEIRARFDPLGCEDCGCGAFKSGHVPHIAPMAYLCVWYPGLDGQGLEAAVEEADHHIPSSYRELLTVTNGGRWLGVCLQGAAGALIDRSAQGIGQPISLRYQNVFERPDYIPAGHLGIGSINGAWYSQGHLYLTSTGEVELYNARFDMIGARWGSLAEFLTTEMQRRFTLYDAGGQLIEGAKLLPGDTADWEAMAAAEKPKDNPGAGRLLRGLKARLGL